MASGVVESSTARQIDSDRYPRRIIVEWSSVDDIASNTSTINYTVKASGTNSLSWIQAYSIHVSIGGEEVYSSTSRFKLYSGAVLKSGSVAVHHNNDGTGSAYISIQAALYVASINSTYSGYITLDTIARISKIKASDAYVDSVSNVYVLKQNSSFKHSIACVFKNYEGWLDADGNTSDTEVVFSKSEIPFTIPHWFLNRMPADRYMQCTLTCYTYVGDTKLDGYDYTGLTVVVGEYAHPLISGTVIDTNEQTVALTGDSSVLVAEKSSATVTVSTTPIDEAYITSTTVNGSEISGTSVVIDSPISNKFDLVTTDSRQYTGSATIETGWIPYVHLSCSASDSAVNASDNTAQVNFYGTYFNGTFGKTANTLSIKYRVDSGDWKYTQYSLDGNSYSVSLSLAELVYTRNHIVSVELSDELETIKENIHVKAGIPVFDFGREDFRLNVPLSIGDARVHYVLDSGRVMLRDQDIEYVYRKWSDGYMELWYLQHFRDLKLDEEWMGEWQSRPLLGGSWPVDFISSPYYDISVGAVNAATHILYGNVATSETMPRMWVTRPQQDTIGYLDVFVRAFGLWSKEQFELPKVELSTEELSRLSE